ncbi:PrpF protein, partial [Rhizoctonia solani]
MQRFLAAHFCRGGTSSKGLFLQDSALAHVSHATRERIILAAMGRLTLLTRNYEMGGGISSLSKVAILHAPGAQHPSSDSPNAFPGVPWANDIAKARESKSGWDVVYRFVQVGVREPELDWGSTCGNLVSAAAMTAINWNLVQNESILSQLMRANPKSRPQMTLPIRILAANNGLVVTAKIPVTLDSSITKPTLVAVTGGDAVIAGVPGTGAPVVIETPIPTAPLRTGNSRDVLHVGSHEIECSIIDTGLPVIFVNADRLLNIASSKHTVESSPVALDADMDLMDLIERIRAAGAIHAKIPLSSAAPKVCLVGPTDRKDADMMIRAVSVGNIHRTVPATTLSALASAVAIPGTIVQSVSSSPTHAHAANIGDVVSLTIAHPAGTASASVKIGNIDGVTRPEAIVYTRTARLLFAGSVAVPENVFQEDQ